jgi:hypothetical protein
MTLAGAQYTYTFNQATEGVYRLRVTTTDATLDFQLVTEEIEVKSAGGAGGDPLATTVPGSYTAGTAGYQLGRIGSADATVAAPVTASGDIELTQGADYNASDGTQLDFTITGQPSFTGGSCIMRITNKSGETTYVEITGSVTSATTLRFQLTAAQTAAITVNANELSTVHRFEIAVTLATSGRVVKPYTVKTGKCTVTKGAADIP